MTKKLIFIFCSVMCLMVLSSKAQAGGMFGPLQTISREAGGLNTAIGYRYVQDTYHAQSDYQVRQNQVYSQASYGASGVWEIYGRIGITDLKISDAFKSSVALTSTAKDNFEENWKFFGTLGGKAFLPFNKYFGLGAFVQGSYNFSNFTDNFSGTQGGASFVADWKVKHLWDVNFGVGLQATTPCGIRLYAGPYVYYAEADAHLSSSMPGLQAGAQSDLLNNKVIAGGFLGVDIPLAKGFRLNIEGQYTDRFSVGSAIAFAY